VLPYLATPALHAGPLPISVYAIFAFLSILAGQWISLRRSIRSGLDAGASRELIFWCSCLGLAGSHLWWLASHPNSGSVISLKGMVSFGGIFGISVGIVLKLLWAPLADVLKWFDAASYAMIFGQLIGRIGCALQHDHLGIRSRSFLAVAFPAGSRFDLGLLEFLFMIPFAVAVISLGRRAWPPGLLFGAIFMIYGAFRICLDTLRMEQAHILGVSEDVLGGSVMMLMGLGGLLLGVLPKRLRPPIRA
jgi:prolipoprotein diacylglyceryltransferase